MSSARRIAFALIVMIMGGVHVGVEPDRVARAQGDDLAALSDEFDSAARLAEWKRHDLVEGWPSQIAALDVNATSPGHLYVEPYTSVWYAGFRAPFLFREVTGDFVVTARVQTLGKRTDFPDVEGSLAGVMIREPRQGRADTWKPEEESYVSFTTGLASGPGGTGPSLETTVTTQARSPLEWHRSRAGWVELRLARIGSAIVLLHRFDGGGWVVTHLDQPSLLGRYGGMRAGMIDHPGLGRTLQVGITAMTDWTTIRERYNGLGGGADTWKAFNAKVVTPPEGMPDLRARVDYVRFGRASIPARFQGRRLADLTAAELLSFLGD